MKDLQTDIKKLNAEKSNLNEENAKKELSLQSNVSRMKFGIWNQTCGSANQFKVHKDNNHNKLTNLQMWMIMNDLNDDIKVLRSRGKA